MNDEVFQEVDEALRQEKIMKQAKKRAPLIIGLFIAVLIATLSYQAWRNHTIQQNEHETDLIISAIDKTPPPSAQEQINALNAYFNEKESHRLDFIAKLLLASLYEQKNQEEKADEMLASIDKPKLYHDLAKLIEAYKLLEAKNYSLLEKSLEPYRSPSSPFYASAIELLAFSAFEQNQQEKAEQLFRTLIEYENAPPTMRERATKFLSLLKHP